MGNQQQYDTMENTICQQRKNIHLKNLNENSRKYEQIIENAVNDIINGTSKKNESVNENTTIPKSGIYLIVNKINGKWYVGSTCNFQNRCYDHIRKLNTSYHNNDYLRRAWNKYGKDAFEFRMIEDVTPEQNTLWNEENKYLKIAETNQDISYNLDFDARGGKISEYSRKKISDSRKNFRHSEKSKQKISNSLKGKIHSQETRNKLAYSLKYGDNNIRDKNIYTFINKYTNESYTGCRRDFSNKYKLSSGNLSTFIRKIPITRYNGKSHINSP